MANQPKKYTKFVATAATATLVASAIVPVASAASFSDVSESNSHAESIQALVTAGVIQGYPDGTFKPNQTLTRGQVVKMLGKWAESKGIVVPADYATTARFTDLAADAKDQELVKYAALVSDAGIFNGSNGALNAAGDITRENMALVLDRAYEAITGSTLVKLAEGSTDLTVSDLNTAKAESRGAIQALRNLGITVVENFLPKNSVTRAQFASFLYKTISAEAPVAKELAIESVKASTAKTITVSFNKAVEDTSKATVEVLRGAFKQTVTVKWAEDKKSVQLVNANNFQAGDYTVNISGLTEKVLTGTVKFEAQKVASIEILSDIAVVSVNPSTGLLASGDTATAGYVVKDQYGTDITSTTGLSTNDANTVRASNGTITISGTALVGKRLGDLVPVVLIHQATGATATQTLKLSAAATIAKVEGTGVVNAKGEAVSLTDATKANSVYLTLKLTDQYGNALNAANAQASLLDGILVANQNPLVANIASAITTQVINGKSEFVLKFSAIDASTQFRGGVADILFIAKANGEKFTYSVTVNETAASDSISIGQPEYAVAGEAIKFPITVTDKAGNLITDVKVLADTVKGIKANNSPVAVTNFEVKDGQVFFIIPATSNTQTGFKTLILTSSTYKVGTLTYEVAAAAKPTAIRGFKSGVIKTGVVKNLTWADVNVEDQYGRVMTTAALTDLTAYDFKVVGVNGTYITKTGDKQITSGSNNGSATVQLTLVKDGAAVANTTVNATLRVTDGKEYDSFEISLASDKVQAISTSVDAATLTVNGILDGGKVALDSSEYTASVVGVPGAVSAGAISVDKSELEDKGNYPDAEYTLRVIINATGEVLERKITVSAKAKSAQDVFFTTTAAGGTYSTATPIAAADLFVTAGTAKTVATELVAGNSAAAVNFAIVDQYGNKSIVAGSAVSAITVVPEKVSDVTITNNGTKNAAIKLASGVESAVVTIKVTIGSVTKELKVTVEER